MKKGKRKDGGQCAVKWENGGVCGSLNIFPHPNHDLLMKKEELNFMFNLLLFQLYCIFYLALD